MEEHVSTPATGPTNRTSLSLAAATNALTRFLLDSIALPAYLKNHGALLLAFTSGAAVATTLYEFLHRNRENRAKFRLAVYHIARMVENTPEFLAFLDRPCDLFNIMNQEVSRMIGLHLTTREAGNVMTELKRKVWSQIYDQRVLVAKRQKCKMSVCEDDFACENYVTGVVSSKTLESLPKKVTIKLQTTPPPVGSPTKSQLTGDVQELKYIGTASVENSPSREQRTRFHNSQQESPSHRTPLSQDAKFPPSTTSSESLSEQSSSVIKITNSLRLPETQSSASTSGRGAYRHPLVSDPKDEASTPTSAPRPKRPVFTGYGLDYDNKTIYSSPSPPSSVHLPEKSMLETATYRAFNPKAPRNRLYKPPFIKTPKAKKPPSTVKSRQLPNTMALKSGNKKTGTWLMPVKEASSSPDSPSPNVTESHQSDNGLLGVHKESPCIRDFFQQEEEEVAEQEQQQQGSITTQPGEEWPSPLLVFSNPESVDAEEIAGFQSPLASIDSPPSATAISPPMPSPRMLSSLGDTHIPEFSKPPGSPVDSLLPSDEDFSLPVSPLHSLLPSEEGVALLEFPVDPLLPFEEHVSLHGFPVDSLLPSDGDVSLYVEANSTRASSPIVFIIARPKALQALPSEPAIAVIQPPTPSTPPISLPSSTPPPPPPPPLPKKRAHPMDNTLRQNLDLPAPPAKSRGRPKKAILEPQEPQTPAQPRKLRDRPQKAVQELQTPNAPQEPEKMRGRPPKPKPQAPVDPASMRRSARKTAFKGQFF